jgi:flagellar biosynthetic protein FliR
MLPAILTAEVVGFLVVFARLGAMVMLFPGIGDESIPTTIRLALALLMTFVIYPTVLMSLPAMPTTILALASLMGREIVLGLMLGGAVRILMQSLHVAGTIIANQSGLAAALMFDPAMGAQGTLVTRFLGLLGVMTVFALDLHHLLIAGIARSYALFSASGPLMVDDFANAVTGLVAQSFALGVQLSAPFLILGVVFNVGLGLVSRLVPQLQVFFIALPLSVLLSLALLMVTVGMMLSVFAEAFAATLGRLLGT